MTSSPDKDDEATPATERLAEIFQALIRPGFNNWKVSSSDDAEEDFSPLTLINSFIESEMDLEFCFQLFDVVVERLKDRTQNGTLTHIQIHSTAIKALIDAEHPQAGYWLGNYENIYGPDTEPSSDDPELVNVRSASELRAVIAEYLGFEGDTATHLQAKGSEELKFITNRLIKLIRYCGFYRVPRAFLRSFIQELSEHSIKGFVPRANLSEAEVESALDQAERFLALARSEVGANAGKARRFVELALEDIGRVSLTQLNFFPAAARDSFRIFEGLLNGAERLRRSSTEALPHLQGLRRRLEELAIHRGLDISALQADCTGIKKSLEYGRTLQSIKIARRVVRVITSLLSTTADFANLVSFSSRSESGRCYVELAYPFMETRLRNVALGEDRLSIDIPISLSFHELVEFGRKIRIRDHLGLDDNLETYSFGREEADVAEANDIIPVLIVDGPVDDGRESAFIDNYRTVVLRLRRCIIMVHRIQFEKWLRTSEDIRTILYAQFTKMFPEAPDWRDRTYEHTTISLPDNLRERERTSIINELRGFDRGYDTSVAVSMARMFEGAIKEHTMLLYSLLRRQNGNDELRYAIDDLSRNNQLFDLIEWWSKIEGLIPRRTGLADLLPSKAVIGQIHMLREKRNEIVHHEIELEPFEVQEFLTGVLSIISCLNELAQRYERCVLIPGAAGHGIAFTASGNSFSIRVDEGTWCLGYRDIERQRPTIIRAYKFCTVCKAIERVSRVAGKNHICQSRRNRKARLEGSWPALVAQAERLVGANATALGRQVPMLSGEVGGEKRAKNWIRGIAGGLATALGPFGAPIQAVIDAQDDKRADEMDKILESLVHATKEIEEHIVHKELVSLQIGDDIATALYKVGNNFRRVNQRSQLRREGTNNFVGWPFVSVSGILETELIDEFIRLYGHDIPLLLADLRMAGIDQSRLRISGSPAVDIGYIVSSLRGLDPRMVLGLAELLHAKNPGSDVISLMRTSTSELLAELRIQTTPPPQIPDR